MEEKNKKRQIAKISVFITSIFVIFISITYAFITQTLTGTKEVVINAGVLDLVLEEENAITISDALPMYDQVGMIQEDVFVFRLVNKTSNPTNYVLKLSKINADNELSPSDVKYYLTKEGVGEPKLLSSLPTDGTVDSGTIAGSDTIDYTLRLWINSAVTDETAIAGKTLSYKIDAEASQEIAKVSFTDELENKVQESTSTFPNFKQISSETNGRGIYKYTEDGEDIYYWRGNIDAVATEENGIGNHVIFGGYCWEMVRTTKTGGIKMIYDGTPVEANGVQTCPNTGSNSQLSVGNIKFNASYNDNAYVGYMYGLTGVTAEPSSPQCIKLNSAGTAAEVGTETTKETCEQAGGKWATTAYESTHANVVNSNIKGEIDKWFSTSSLNTEENLEKIEDTVYCNDRSLDTTSSGTGYGKSVTDYGADYRLCDNKTPSLECVNENDRFTVKEENGNGDLTYPVGLLTADEIVLAGGLYGSNNTDYYLNVGSNNYYWALSPRAFNGSFAVEFRVISSGSLGSYYVDDTNGVRPVVSLAAGTEITGLGTETSPFEIK